MLTSTRRNSHWRCSARNGVLKTFAKFTGKHLRQGLVFNKLAGLRSGTLLKKRLWYECFPVNFAKFLRTLFLPNTSKQLLLYKGNFISNQTLINEVMFFNPVPENLKKGKILDFYLTELLAEQDKYICLNK